MNVPRAAASLAAFAVCAVAGQVKAAREAEKLRSEKDLLRDLRAFSQLVANSRSTLHEAAAKLSGEGELSILWNSIARGLCAGDPFAKAYNAAPKPVLSAEAAGIMKELAECLGTGNHAEEAQRLSLAVDKLSVLCESREPAVAQRNKLICALSTLLGLAAALLLL